MRMPRVRLRWQLLLSYLPLMLTPVLVLGVVVRNVAEQGLTVLVTQEAQQRALTLSSLFNEFYTTHGNWNGVDRLLVDLRNNPLQNPNGRRPAANRPIDNPPPRDPRDPPVVPNPQPAPNPQPGQILITDSKGIILASDVPSVRGQMLSADALAHGVILMVEGQQVGTLVVGVDLGVLGAQEKQLLDAVSSALLVTGIIISAVGVGIALWLSGTLTAPMKDLMSGVKQLATGNWMNPVRVRSQNEFADLTLAFNSMAEQLTRQQQQQRQMIADIAHDLRTPLSVMGLEVEGIRAGLQTPEEATSSLQEEIDWLHHMIDDLHTLSMMDNGQITLQPDNVPLAPYLCDLCEKWKTMAAKQNKTVICSVPENLPSIEIDPYRMRQVFGNLLNNALQHTPDGTQITMTAVLNQDQVEISVSDNGKGISQEDLAHIFDRFYRADRARNRRGQRHGSGLGLSIAYQLVGLHHGLLTVESPPGSGATFRVRLPLVQPMRADAAASQR